jgi:hypothetical protein
MTTTGHAWTIAATKPTGIQDTIAINSGSTINGWLANIKTNLVQTPGKLEFSLKNTDSDSKLLFIPHYSRYQDRYGIYFNLSGTAGTAVPAPPCPATGGAGGADGSGGGAIGGSNGIAGGDTGGAGTAVGGTPGIGVGGSGNVVGGAGSATVAMGGISGGGSASGGKAGVAGSSAANAHQDNTGCSCGVTKTHRDGEWSLAALLALGLAVRRRRAGAVSGGALRSLR